MKIHVVTIWHYHQPWYYSPEKGYFIKPFVRLHTVGNYLKMALILKKFKDMRAAFTFSGSLLKQLELYRGGVKDRAMIISEKLAKDKTLAPIEIVDLVKIPGGFFDISKKRMEFSPRYLQLFKKSKKVFKKCLNVPRTEFNKCIASSFEYQDLVDLATLYNLLWMDPLVISELYPGLLSLLNKAKSENPEYTENDILRILKTHEDSISKIPGIYQHLASSNLAELLLVPYSHPIMPIVNSFGWDDDLELHIDKSLDLFKKVLNYRSRGLWPPELAINEEILDIIAKKGMEYAIIDVHVLKLSGVDISKVEEWMYPRYIDFNKRLYLFLRCTELSDDISFRYPHIPVDSAISDFTNKLKSLAQIAPQDGVVVLALDGENPWENYSDYGDEFLMKIYSKLLELQSQGILSISTASEYIDNYSNKSKPMIESNQLYLDFRNKDISNILRYNELPRRKVKVKIAESSWAGEGLRLSIWVGKKQENTAWMWLAIARDALLKLTNSNSIYEALKKAPNAVEMLLWAEGSDWFWWYGKEWGSPKEFDPLFKEYLRSIYTLLNVIAPSYLYSLFYPDGEPCCVIDVEGKRGNKRNYVQLSLRRVIDKVTIKFSDDKLYVNLTPKKLDILWDPSYEVSIYIGSQFINSSPLSRNYNVYPRYVKTPELGLPILYEVSIRFAHQKNEVRRAMGDENYETIWSSNVTVNAESKMGSEISFSIPTSIIGIEKGSNLYIAIAVFKHGYLIEHSTKTGCVYEIFCN